MSRYEEMRKQRLEDHKKREPHNGEDEVHKATTVFHGGESKGFVDHPSYLR